MNNERESLEPIKGASIPARRRLDLKGELTLAVMPTVVILVEIFLIETYSQQRILFASLASSAFLIYLDPTHGTNTVRTLVSAHSGAMVAGLLMYLLFGHGYIAAGGALLVTIIFMIFFDVVHPPAIGTSLIFAFQSGAENNISLFALALGVIATLVVMQRLMLWLVTRLTASADARLPRGATEIHEQ